MALLLSSGLIEAAGATRVVQLVNFAFQPSALTINAGDTVLWTNTTITSHNIVSSNSTWAASPFFTSPGTFSVTLVNPGTYGYFCMPHQAFGMTGTITVQSVANQPPSVSLTNPVGGVVLAAPANVTLKASASDPDGSVANVQFFSGTSLLGSKTASPYTLTVSNLAAGSYSFTAKAIDNLGLSKTSAPVNVSIVNPAPIVFDTNLVISQGALTLRFPVTPGLKYDVEYTTNLSNWLTLTNLAPASSPVSLSVPTSAGDRRLFRTRLLPNP